MLLNAHDESKYLCDDGGAGRSNGDLWCTYAAVRAFTWLDAKAKITDKENLVAFLRNKENSDGSFSWQKGLEPDVWATFYCLQALYDLGEPSSNPAGLRLWLDSLQDHEGGFAMKPGQAADVWATYYTCRLYSEILCKEAPNKPQLAQWLNKLQTSEGGLTWSPSSEHADSRACYYGVRALSVLNLEASWDREKLIRWLQDRQHQSGGFEFAKGQQPCMWATFRAVNALQSLSALPANPLAALNWIKRQTTDKGIRRWEGYQREDVWAVFCAVGTKKSLLAMNVAEAQFTDFEKHTLPQVLLSYRTEDAGFTYCPANKASDALTTASLVLSNPVAPDQGHQGLYKWLQDAQMPWENGIMYMLARGSEIRCTNWALSALKHANQSFPNTQRLKAWVRKMQNRDGGFGYWEGRGSDLIATGSALSVCELLDPELKTELVGSMVHFTQSCCKDGFASNIPSANSDATATAIAARILRAGGDSSWRGLFENLKSFSALGGFSLKPRAIPDLHTTYQVVLTHLSCLGEYQDKEKLAGFLKKLQRSNGTIQWSPLGQGPEDPLAVALYTQLHSWVHGESKTLATVIL